MSDAVIVYKGRTNILPVSLGIDVSGDTITSEIRTDTGVLICTWGVAFDGDGTDGECIFTLDNTITSPISYTRGLMDIKRVSGSEPYPVLDQPLEVEFRESITA